MYLQSFLLSDSRLCDWPVARNSVVVLSRQKQKQKHSKVSFQAILLSVLSGQKQKQKLFPGGLIQDTLLLTWSKTLSF